MKGLGVFPKLAASLVASLVVGTPFPAAAQDANYQFAIEEIEETLRRGELEIFALIPSRGLPGERTYRATVRSGERIFQAKYAPAPRGGDEFNNRPRYELAAYELQKLFLDPADYVVPPTVLRCWPVEAVQSTLDLAGSPMTPSAEATFGEWPVTLVALQYWLRLTEVPEKLKDDDRLAADETYARHLGNLNLLTYLIRHSDSNEGNFLRSLDPENPRVFSVDNGVAFSWETSDRGTYWRELRLDRFPAESIDRLRSYTLEDLQGRLGVLAEFAVQEGACTEVEPGENLDPGRGIRQVETRFQVGLTEGEIRDIHDRLQRLLGRIDEGRYEVFTRSTP